MAERVYKTIRLTGCSQQSYENAISIALEKAGESLHGLAWFEVTEMRGAVREGGALEYQATIHAAFKID